MYLRTTKVKRPDGHVDEYIRLVESIWNNGRPRHQVICNLGRKDLLAPHAEALLADFERRAKTKDAQCTSHRGVGLGSDTGGASVVGRAGTAREHR